MHVSRASETASPDLVSPLQEAEAGVTVGWAGALPRARDPPPPASLALYCCKASLVGLWI